MNFKCIVCLQPADVLTKEGSLCTTHFLECDLSGRGQQHLFKIQKIWAKGRKDKQDG